MSQAQTKEDSQDPDDDILALARGEAVASSKNYTKKEKAYFLARKAGMRDKATCEYLGTQPLFFDSAATIAPLSQREAASAPEKAEPLVQQADLENSKPEFVLPGPAPSRHCQYAENASSAFRAYPEAMEALLEEKPESVLSERQFTYPDGSSFYLSYSDAELIEIKIEDGSWIKEASNWAFYDRNGKKLDQLLGEMQVSERGDIIARRNDGYTEIQFFDGTFQMIQADGSSETHYTDGWLVKVDAKGNRLYCKNGVEYVLGTDAKLVKKAPDLNAVASDRRLAELNGWKGGKDSWQSMQKKSGVWYKNAQGDRLKQDDKTGTATVFHDDGTWEQVDKNGKLKIRLAV